MLSSAGPCFSSLWIDCEAGHYYHALLLLTRYEATPAEEIQTLLFVSLSTGKQARKMKRHDGKSCVSQVLLISLAQA
jgi:hypothetical protein